MDSKPRPPDGGWGWVIVACGFTNHMFTVGVMMSLSVFYVSWLDQFGESKGATSWILSIGIACTFGLGPIPASIAVRFGFRVVAFAGGLLTCSGLILSAFATSVSYLVVSIGVIMGIGCCFLFLPAVAIVAIYFDKRRSLAMGLNTAGVGIGAFILAPLLNYLEEIYGWRGALLLLGALSLHTCVSGMLMRDLETEREDDIVGDNLESDEEEQRNDTSDELDLTTTPMIKLTCDDSNVNDCRISSQDQEAKVKGNSWASNSSCNNADIEKHYFKMDESRTNSQVHQLRNAGLTLHASHDDMRRKPFPLIKNHHGSSFRSLDALTLGMKYAHRSITKGSQTMGLFLLASIPFHLNEKHPSGSSLTYQSNISMKENEAGVHQVSEKSTCKSHLVSRILTSKAIKANRDLFSDKAHITFCVSNFITNLSFITPVVYMVDRAVYQGISKSAGAILVSANGIGNVAGRVISGCLADRLRNRHMCMYISSLIVCGVGTMLSDLCGNNVVLHAVYATFFGFLMGAYTVLAPIVCVDLVGVDIFPTSYGQALFCMGIASVIGPPLAGWLFDWTKSYLLSYLAIGLFFVVSGAMLLPFLCRNKKTSSVPSLNGLRSDADI